MCIFPKQNKVIKTAQSNFTHWTVQELFQSETISKIKNNHKIFIDATYSSENLNHIIRGYQ